MELTQQLREYAEERGLTTASAIAAGLDEKAAEYREVELVRLPSRGGG